MENGGRVLGKSKSKASRSVVRRATSGVRHMDAPIFRDAKDLLFLSVLDLDLLDGYLEAMPVR